MDQDYFVIATECHLQPPRPDLAYYPNRTRRREGGGGLLKVWIRPDYDAAKELPSAWAVEDLIRDMDEAGIDICCALRSSSSDKAGGFSVVSTNGWVLEQMAKYPNRLILEANVGPAIRRGMKHALWEMEYLVKERGAKLLKVYQVEDEGPLNDRRMWPFYEKAQELRVPLTIHLGIAQVSERAQNALPIQLEDVLSDFPDLKIIGYHMAWPFHEQLFSLASTYNNIYVGLSGIIGWFTNSPWRGYEMLGEAIEWCGVEKLVFGLDWPVIRTKACVDYIKNLDMPDELCEKYGWRKLTPQDKQAILGGNLAKMIGIEMKKRIPSKALA